MNFKNVLNAVPSSNEQEQTKKISSEEENDIINSAFYLSVQSGIIFTYGVLYAWCYYNSVPHPENNELVDELNKLNKYDTLEDYFKENNSKPIHNFLK